MKITILKVFASNMLGAGLGFSLNVILARLLSLEEYGKINFIFSVVVIISTSLDFGFSNASVIVYNKFKDKIGKAAIYATNRAFAFTILYSLPLVLAALFLIHKFYSFEFKEVVVILLSTIFYTIYRYVVSLHQAEGAWNKYNFLNVLNNVFKICLVGIFIFVCHYVLDLMGVYTSSMYGYTTSIILLCILVMALTRNILKVKRPDGEGGRELTQSLKRIVINIGIANLVIIITMRADSLIILKYLGSQKLGIYSAANTLALFFPLITISLMNVFLKEAASRDRKMFLSRIMKAQVNLLPIVIMIIGVAVIFSKPMILLIFGERFAETVNIFRILLVAFIGGVFFTPLESFFYANGQREIRNLKLIQMITFLSLSILLIQSFDIYGVAFSVVASRLVGWTVLMMKARRELSVTVC